jgi:hypothetical protein
MDIKQSDMDIMVMDLEEGDGDMTISLPELDMNVFVINGAHCVKLEISVYNYSVHNNCDCSEGTCNIEETVHSKGEIPKLLSYLHKLFRDDGTLRYSKLTDKGSILKS